MWHFSLTTPIICPDLMTKFGVFIPDGFWWTKEGKVEAGFLFVPLSFWQLTKNADSEESECSSLEGMILPKNRLSYTHKKKRLKCKSFTRHDKLFRLSFCHSRSPSFQSNIKATERFLNASLREWKLVWQQNNVYVSLRYLASLLKHISHTSYEENFFFFPTHDTQKLFAEKIFILAQNDAF